MLPFFPSLCRVHPHKAWLKAYYAQKQRHNSWHSSFSWISLSTPPGKSAAQKWYCHLPVNEDKFAGTTCSVLIYINSLSALIMGIIKLHPGAKQGFWPEQRREWISSSLSGQELAVRQQATCDGAAQVLLPIYSEHFHGCRRWRAEMSRMWILCWWSSTIVSQLCRNTFTRAGKPKFKPVLHSFLLKLMFWTFHTHSSSPAAFSRTLDDKRSAGASPHWVTGWVVWWCGQFITGPLSVYRKTNNPFTLTHTPRDNLESSVHLMCTFLYVYVRKKRKWKRWVTAATGLCKGWVQNQRRTDGTNLDEVYLVISQRYKNYRTL